jgi:hypothetical protein
MSAATGANAAWTIGTPGIAVSSLGQVEACEPLRQPNRSLDVDQQKIGALCVRQSSRIVGDHRFVTFAVAFDCTFAEGKRFRIQRILSTRAPTLDGVIYRREIF